MSSIVTEAQLDDVPEGKHVLVILDGSGDTKIIWDPTNPDEVENARATFDSLVGEKKMAAYAVKRDGEKGEVVRHFDPKAEKLIFAPRMVGG